MKAFVIVFILTFTQNHQNEDILVQFGGGNFWFDTKQECEEMLSEYGPFHIIDEFMKGVDESEVFVDVNIPSHCTEYDIENKTYPEYPEFDISPEDLPFEIRA